MSTYLNDVSYKDLSKIREGKTARMFPPRREIVENPGVDQGAAAPYVPSGSDDKCVRTEENPEAFVRCRFCRPGANAGSKTCESSKKWRSATFSIL